MAHELIFGSLLDHGKYRIEGILGQGGFGITYLVKDLGLDKHRAIKEFFPKDFCKRDDSTSQVLIGTDSTEELVDRLKKKFIKEARNLASLDRNDGIVKIYAVFEENNTAYYVMDYIKGATVSSIVKNSGPIPVDKAVKYVMEIGNTLAYVHSHRINHLDIKPGNIIIRSEDDRPILIDFGLAKQYDKEGYQTSTTPTGISHGYAPFEQYREGGVSEFSPQTDIYSLAATLYYMISGQVPPHASDLIENDLDFPSGFPYYLQEPIRKAMANRRSDRPESVTDFIKSLRYTEDDSTQTLEVTQLPTEKAFIQNENILEVEESQESLTQNVQLSSQPPVTGQQVESAKEPVKIHTTDTVKSPATETAKEPAKTPSTESATESAIESENPHVDHQVIISADSPVKKAKKSNKFVFPFLVVALLIAFVITLLLSRPSAKNAQYTTSDTIAPMNQVDSIKMVNNLSFNTSLGTCLYTGPVDDDGKPNGHGVATWEGEGALKYDGEWEHGKMEGQADFLHSSGDTFVGTFKNDEFYEGKYTIKDDGSFFIGTFKNGQAAKGRWYDKNGKEM